MSATMIENDATTGIDGPPPCCEANPCTEPATNVAILPCGCHQLACDPHFDAWWERSLANFVAHPGVVVHHPPGCGTETWNRPPRGHRI